jgi:hypothetical protein
MVELGLVKVLFLSMLFMGSIYNANFVIEN